MDFLARFKGRTNFVTKEGIDPLMSEASTPIRKNISASTYDFSRSPTKAKTIGTLGHSMRSSPSPVKLIASPKASPLSGLEIRKNLSLDHRVGKNSNMMQLRILTDPNFFERQDSHTRTPNPTSYLTPQHKLLTEKERLTLEDLTFSHRISRLKTNPKIGQYSVSQSNVFDKFSDRQKPQQLIDSPLSPKHVDYFINSAYRDAYLNKGVENVESHESRLARMSFIDRQEKVLSKYRQKPSSHGDIYGQNTLNSSWERGMKMGSPKH
jgi:hypothetical protein